MHLAEHHQHRRTDPNAYDAAARRKGDQPQGVAAGRGDPLPGQRVEHGILRNLFSIHFGGYGCKGFIGSACCRMHGNVAGCRQAGPAVDHGLHIGEEGGYANPNANARNARAARAAGNKVHVHCIRGSNVDVSAGGGYGGAHALNKGRGGIGKAVYSGGLIVHPAGGAGETIGSRGLNLAVVVFLQGVDFALGLAGGLIFLGFCIIKVTLLSFILGILYGNIFPVLIDIKLAFSILTVLVIILLAHLLAVPREKVVQVFLRHIGSRAVVARLKRALHLPLGIQRGSKLGKLTFVHLVNHQVVVFIQDIIASAVLIHGHMGGFIVLLHRMVVKEIGFAIFLGAQLPGCFRIKGIMGVLAHFFAVDHNGDGNAHAHQARAPYRCHGAHHIPVAGGKHRNCFAHNGVPLADHSGNGVVAYAHKGRNPNAHCPRPRDGYHHGDQLIFIHRTHVNLARGEHPHIVAGVCPGNHLGYDHIHRAAHAGHSAAGEARGVRRNKFVGFC